MITVNNTLTMPNELEEISIAQGKEIMSILDKTKFKPNRIAKGNIISILSGLPFRIVDKIDNKGIDDIYDQLPFSKDKISGYIPDTFRLKRTLYGRVNMNHLTVKEYAEIMFWVNEGDDHYQHLGKILATIYRPIVSKNKNIHHILKNIAIKLFHKWKLKHRRISPRIYKSYTIEPLNDFHEQNSKLFEEHFDFQIGYSVINGLLSNYNKDLKSTYPILFKVASDSDTDSDSDADTDNSVPELDDIYGMYHTICTLSTNLFERDAWWDKPLTHLMKYLTYLKQLNAYEKRRAN